MSEDKDIIKGLRDKINQNKDMLKDLKVGDSVEQLNETFIIEKYKELVDLIPSIAPEYNNEIPFTVIKEKLDISFELVRELLINAVMKKDLLGFINDKSTASLVDDSFIFRTSRILDTIDPEYEVG